MDRDRARNANEQFFKNQVHRIARDIVGIQKRVSIIERSAQTPYRSVSNGSTTYYDENGNPRQVVGQQPDGTYTTFDLNGDPLAPPSKPFLQVDEGTLTVTWDGRMSSGSKRWPADFSHVEVHVSTGPNFIADDSTEMATFHAMVGGTVTFALPGDTEYWVKLVAVNTSGVRSLESTEQSIIVPPLSGIETYRQDDEPTGLDFNDFGDIWYDTSDGNKQYFWDGLEWVSVVDEGISIAQQAADSAGLAATAAFNLAEQAQLAADDVSDRLDVAIISAGGRSQVTYSINAPGTALNNPGDTWFQEDSANPGRIIGQWAGEGDGAGAEGDQWQPVTLSHQIISSVDAGSITVGTLHGDRVGANTITVNKLAVADFTNLVLDGGFEQAPGEAWTYATGTTQSTTQFRTGAKSLEVSSASIVAATYVGSDPLVSPGEELYYEYWYKSTAGATLSGGLRFSTGATNVVSNLGAATTAWTKISGSVVVPAAGSTISTLRFDVSTGAGQSAYIDGLVIRRKNGGELIVDGSIGVNQLAANSVTANKLAVVMGGGNLWTNSSFENSTNYLLGWTKYDNSTVATTSRITTGRLGGAAVRFTWSAPASVVGLYRKGPNDSWVGDKKYTISWYARAESGDVIGKMMSLASNAPAAVLDKWHYNPPLTTSWQRYAFTFHRPADSVDNMYFGVQSGSTDGIMDFDDVQLEEGEYPTAYMPKTDEILPGTILGAMIKANEITAEKMATGTILIGASGVGSPITYAPNYDPSTKETPAGAQTKADTARTGAVSDLTTLWGHPSNTTFIDGGDIFTDSIRAKSLLLMDTLNYLSDPTVRDPSTASWAFGSGSSGVAGSGTTPGHIIMNVSTANVNAHTGDATYWATEADTEYHVVGEYAGDPGNVGNTTFTPALHVMNNTASMSFPSGEPVTVTAATDWTAFEFNTTMPAGAARMRWYPYVNSGTVNNKVRVRNVKVRRKTNGKLIVDGSIHADHIESKSITTDKLEATVLTSGFVLITGSINVGLASWTPEQGLIIPATNGNETRFPADGSPSVFEGHIRAESLTVRKDLMMMGFDNFLAGSLILANGVTAPTIAPTVSHTWDVVGNAATATWKQNGTSIQARGMCQRYNDATSYATAIIAYNSTGIRFATKAGALWAGDLANTASWGTNFVAWGGITYASGHYFLYGQDTTRSHNWYVYKISATTGAKVAEYYTANPLLHTESMQMRIAANETLGQVYLAYIRSDYRIILNTWNLNLGWVSAREAKNMGIRTDIMGVYVGQADIVGGVNYLFVNVSAIPFASGNSTFTFNLSTLAETSQYNFPSAYGQTLYGLTYDSGFKSFDIEGKIASYSGIHQGASITASYTWYDGAGTPRETQASPPTPYVLPARSKLVIETPPPPHSGITDVNMVDKANRVGIYAAISTSARQRQTYLGVDGNGVSIRRYESGTLLGSSNFEPSINTFINGQSSPGRIETATGGFELNGDGTGSWPAVRPAGEVTAFAGTSAPSGWLLCQGQSLPTATYPRLFAAIQYTFGGSGSNFNVPDMRGRFPLGAGTPVGSVMYPSAHALGQKDGHEKIVITMDQIPQHDHEVAVGWAEVPGLNNWQIADGSGTGFRRAHVVNSSLVGGGSAHDNMPPYTALNYIIKT